jgi:hypothetical protein
VCLPGRFSGSECLTCDPIATSDANGQIFVEEFYPEQWQSIFFLGDTGLLWAADVEDLAIGRLITVDLP